ncbi:hypothetical protein KDW_25090 [Dictyobacter vulcani]|uniref:Uncharacterized protein n=1 Tax=Dictyobacter vulcani TaxID=2607529 RepID=A0A5J4KPH2_9CHLR|nr:hypothetical protein [Dictyobacter vulcani]GER88347.1 hypothetical protein KDW_25090 [Dictyobacter vulcani]
MTIHSYHTTQSITAEQPPVRKAILNDIARNAVVDDEIVAPVDLNIEVDEAGTVIVNALEADTEAENKGKCHKRVMHIPHEKAYQRIVGAAQRKTTLLEKLYTERQQEASQWFHRSFLTATIGAGILLLSVFLPVVLYSLPLNIHMQPIICAIILANVLNIIITAWFFRQTQQANEQVDLYLKGFNDVRNFSMITQFIAQLKIDDTHKQLLQKTLISTSLGLPKQQTDLETAEFHKEPFPEG